MQGSTRKAVRHGRDVDCEPTAVKAGRPIVSVPRAAVAALRDGPGRLTWRQITDKLGIGRRTAIRLYNGTHITLQKPGTDNGTPSATTSAGRVDRNFDFGA